jgi:CheY-like chemotaxis protein
MSEQDTPSPGLVRQVRSALAHLYDYAYLQNHPLAKLVDATGALDQVTRAQKLRRLLLDCIEALRPQAQEEAPSDAARAHAILTYRYVDGVAMREIAERRGLSERQAYRELEKGAVAVASLLQDRLGKGETADLAAPPASAEAAGNPLQAAQREVARLQQSISAELVDLREVLQGVLHLLAPICQRTGVQIAITAPAEWPPVVADRVMLRQALLGLLTHALNSAAQGDLAISIAGGQGYLQLEILESPPATRTRPLAPGPANQLPVGLSVARSLLAAQGGRLEIQPREGRWHAQVSLPTARAATILVIDDNQDLLALLQRYLAGHDVIVVGATDGAQALRLAQELSPQLITLDVMMPSQDGWEILQQLRDSPGTQDTPIVICSVLHEHELAQTMGASDYITKPVVQAELLRVLTHWLGPLRPAG